MKQLTLSVKESKLKFFLELISDFDFVQIEPVGDSDEAILANVSKGLDDLKDIDSGKLKSRPAQALLNEL